MDTTPDPEKGHTRRSSEFERPVSHDSKTTADQHEDEDDVSVKGKGNGEDRPSSRHENDLYPAATLGEPSGDGIYACEETCSPCRTRSRASSIRSRPLSVVPRSKRRGLFGRFTLIPEIERPYDYKSSTKWTITAAVALATAAAPMGSSIFYRMSNSYPKLQGPVADKALKPLSNPSQLTSGLHRPSPICPLRYTCSPCPYFPYGGRPSQNSTVDGPFISSPSP